jgi:hypothetical protein
LFISSIVGCRCSGVVDADVEVDESVGDEIVGDELERSAVVSVVSDSE